MDPNIEAPVTDPIAPAGEGETQPVEAPVIPAGEVQEVTATSEEDEMAALEADLKAAETPEAKAEVQSKINRRFNAVVKQRHEAELRLAELKGRLAGLESKTQEAKPVEAPKPPELVLPPKPKKSDFMDKDGYEDPEAFAEALATWGGDVALAKFNHERQITEAKAKSEQWQTEKERWLATGREKFADFDEVFKSISPEAAMKIGGAISESDLGHELTYYLGKNPKELARISALSAPSAAREIGKLELQLAKPPAKHTTNATAPIVPVAPASGQVTAKSLEEMSFAEYEAKRNRELYGPNWKSRSG